ncbi:MAG: M1 family aminopeptidase [Chloroflexi bacterium]|nr:M1 family aminopeptidase [Chloroflexota bacterium]
MLKLLGLTAIACAFLSACNLGSIPTDVNSTPLNAPNLRLDVTGAPASPTPNAVSEKTAAPAALVKSTPSYPYACGTDDGVSSARQVAARVDIDYAQKAASVDQRLSFTNREDAPLTSIVLDVQANQWDGSFVLNELLVDLSPAYHELDLNRLEVPLAIALPPGCAIEIELRFRLLPDVIRDGMRAFRGFFGYSPRQLNLAHFLPTVAARVNKQWRIHSPAHFGEQIVYDVADWRVEVHVQGATEDLKLAAPGQIKKLEPGLWQVELRQSRDFALSLSEKYQLHEGLTASGVDVNVYTLRDSQAGVNINGENSATHVLAITIQALELFETLFGKYPRDRLVVVQGDFPDGMEFTGLVYVGSAWFAQFDGTPYNYLTLVSVHEIAHQWWYALIGSDAALHPWLDEALATYSEYLFIESQFPADKNWWWSFRVAGYFPQGDVDSVVYEFTTFREYINAIYLRGAQMLHNLREDMGDEQFFQLLRSYAEIGTGQVADPGLFWGLLPAAQAPLTIETRNEFLRDPGVDSLFSLAESAGGTHDGSSSG